VRIAEHALSEFKKDRERTERAFYESAKSERDALQAEVGRLKGEVTGTSERNKELHFYSAQLSSDLADARRRLEEIKALCDNDENWRATHDTLMRVERLAIEPEPGEGGG
jgi:predicted nuclease with TOPRIM domain